MGSHWHPDIKIRRLQPWLVEARLVYSVHPVRFHSWMEFNTIKDGLEIEDEPLYFLSQCQEALDWAIEYLADHKGLAAIVSRWGLTPAQTIEGQIVQLHELISLEAEKDPAERLYEILTVRSGPFRPWGALQGLQPYVEVS